MEFSLSAHPTLLNLKIPALVCSSFNSQSLLRNVAFAEKLLAKIARPYSMMFCPLNSIGTTTTRKNPFNYFFLLCRALPPAKNFYTHVAKVFWLYVCRVIANIETKATPK